MIRHNSKVHKTFKSTHTVTKTLIGGETDYCAERFGYRRDTNGISPSYSCKALPAYIFCYDIVFSEYMPTNGWVMLKDTSTKVYRWSPVNQGNMGFAGLIGTSYPSTFDCVIDDVNMRVIMSEHAGVKFNPEGTISTFSFSVKVLSAVHHCGRVFGIDLTDRYVIRWSGYAINDWSEGIDKGGHIRLDAALGKPLDLIVFDGKIVVLRENGLTLLSTLGDSRHMRLDVSNKFRLSGICENSRIICGGKLWIFTENGLFVFDGNSITQAPLDECMRDYVLKHPKVVDDRYIYYDAEKTGMYCLFEYDTKTGFGNPFAKSCRAAYFTEDKAYAICGLYMGEFKTEIEDANRVWLSRPITFDSGKPALLKKLTLKGSGTFTVEIDCDGRKLNVTAAGEYAYAESAQSFTFTVKGLAHITEMTAEWGVSE